MPMDIRRRDFLKWGAAAGLAAGLTPSATVAEESKPVRVGFIGVGSRGTGHVHLALRHGVQIAAVCDINEANLNRALDIVEKAGGPRPDGYSRGPTDYRRMLQRDDLDAVMIATPMQDHGLMSADALRAGKHVLSEVAAAMTVEECWDLVRATEETGRIFMLSENCCYWRHVMQIQNMIDQGVFGELTFAECGYVHDCRRLSFDAEGKITWRGRLGRDHRGNLYPTHSLGPVAKWLRINRGDRFVSLAATDTRQVAMRYYVESKFPEGHPARDVHFKVGDSTSVMIRTAKGAVIDLRYDTKSARPHPTTTYFSLQGMTASYDSRSGVWIEGRSKSYRQWEPLEAYRTEYDHPMWTADAEKAAGASHGGADYFVTREFYDCVRTESPPPIDVYDAAAWSAIIPLSEQSLAEGGRPVEIPDFTGGKWEQRS